MSRASLQKHPREVAAMFDAVAERYDVTNDVLSLGQDRRWRRAVTAAVAPQPGECILDLAAGTGTSCLPLLASGAAVIPCDFSIGMLKVGKRERPRLPFVAGDAMRLPFGDGVFDAVTITFGLRNVLDPPAALREMRRVTRDDGRLLVCEFSRPTFRPLRHVYDTYLMGGLPTIATKVSSDPESYRYLAESIKAWPDQETLAHLIAAAGWRNVAVRNLTRGIVALHRAKA